MQLETDREVLETELSLARARSSYTPAQRIAQQTQQQQGQQQQREKTNSHIQRLLDERQRYQLQQIRTTTFSPYPAPSTGEEAGAFAFTQTACIPTQQESLRALKEQLSELRVRQGEATPSEMQKKAGARQDGLARQTAKHQQHLDQIQPIQ